MSSCAKCGACSTVCPVFRSSGRESHTARGKLHLLEVLGLGESSSRFVDIFSACLLCGACSAVCPRGIDVCAEITAARKSFSLLAGPHAYEKYLSRKLLDSPGTLRALGILGRSGQKLLAGRLPADSGLRLRLAMFAEDDGVATVADNSSFAQGGIEPLAWFPGCTSRYLFPEILASCRSLLAETAPSVQIPAGLACCGLAHRAAGDLQKAVDCGRRNIEALEAAEGLIVVSCASCYAHLKHYPDLFPPESRWHRRAEQMAERLVEFSDFLESRRRADTFAGKTRKGKLRVFYHDPCHMRYGDIAADKARQLLQKAGNIEVVELADGPRCCGQGGLFHLAHPDIAASIRDQLVEEVLALQPDLVTSTCSGCLMQWKQGVAAAGSRVRVLHLGQLLDENRIREGE